MKLTESDINAAKDALNTMGPMVCGCLGPRGFCRCQQRRFLVALEAIEKSRANNGLEVPR